MRHTFLAFALALPLAAQTPPCESRNDANSTVSTAITLTSFAGPNTFAWQFIPTTTIVAQSGRLFTRTAVSGSSTNFMTVEVWDSNPTTSLPNTRLGGGTWKAALQTTPSWQGANFDHPVVLLSGTPYWFVWIEPGSSIIPTEPGGVVLPRATRSGANWTMSASGAAAKIRLFCSYLDDVNVAVNGNPCPTGSGALGTLFTNQAPMLGTTVYRLETTGFPSSTLVLLVLGVNPTWPSIPLPGFDPSCMLHTDTLSILSGVTGSGNQWAAAAANHAWFPILIPATPSLAGMTLGAQVAGFDPTLATPVQFAVSNGLRSTLF